LTDADTLAPAADAWIGIGHKGAFAWQHPERLAKATELMRAASRRNGYAMVALYSPKDAVNIGGAMRAAMCFGAAAVQIFGPPRPHPKRDRPTRGPTDTQKAWKHLPLMVQEQLLRPAGSTLVAVEIDDGAVALPAFEHPESAVYAFGPEDGCLPDIGADVTVAMPSAFCLNLAAAVNVLLYDRVAKAGLRQARKRPQ
jgi:tRNA(Leu) C34 or U34 (ribose-2'-O)-methylase TrmL